LWGGGVVFGGPRGAAPAAPPRIRRDPEIFTDLFVKAR
jgi:hypothetical protein